MKVGLWLGYLTEWCWTFCQDSMPEDFTQESADAILQSSWCLTIAFCRRQAARVVGAISAAPGDDTRRSATAADHDRKSKQWHAWDDLLAPPSW
jgi:hypothetical protein